MKPKNNIIQKMKPKKHNRKNEAKKTKIILPFRWTSIYSTFPHNSLSEFDNVQVCVISSCDTGNKSFQVILGNKWDQVQFTVKGSSNRTLPRFREPVT